MTARKKNTARSTGFAAAGRRQQRRRMDVASIEGRVRSVDAHPGSL